MLETTIPVTILARPRKGFTPIGKAKAFLYLFAGGFMRYYPIFLDLTDRHCLVVGAGSVGRRKISSLLESDAATVHVVDTAPPSDELQALLEDGRLIYEQRAFSPEDVDGCTLVFAATSDAAVNAAVAAACAAQGILCNCADAPDASTFIVPARIQQGNIAVALSTSGGSPALSRRLRREMEAWLGDRFTGLSELLARLRPLVLALQHETRQNTTLFRDLVDSPLADALHRRDRRACEALLKALLPPELHPHIMELLHDLA